MGGGIVQFCQAVVALKGRVPLAEAYVSGQASPRNVVERGIVVINVKKGLMVGLWIGSVRRKKIWKACKKERENLWWLKSRSSRT